MDDVDCSKPLPPPAKCPDMDREAVNGYFAAAARWGAPASVIDCDPDWREEQRPTRRPASSQRMTAVR